MSQEPNGHRTDRLGRLLATAEWTMSEPSGAHGVTGGLGDELGDTLPCHTTQLTQQLAAMQEERSQELRHGASASFMSPVAHPANVLIMGPGGYRFIDYIKVGLPLSLVCLAVTLLLLPQVGL